MNSVPRLESMQLGAFMQRSRRDRPISRPTPVQARAFALLGITEARIGRNYWVTQAPYLLEASIRMAPGESFSRDAFALLEQELLMRYEGSDHEQIPPDERRLLDELQTLIEPQ